MKHMQKSMKWIFTLMLFAVFFNIASTKTFAATTSVKFSMKFNQTEARKVFQMVNDFRQGKDAWYWNTDNATKTYVKNLPALKYDYDLEKIAMLRAQELIIRFDHTRPNGQLCFTAANDTKYLGLYCGENVAYGYNSAQAVHLGFREDNECYAGQGHRRNMLSNSFGAIGLACAEYKGAKFWVEIFSYQAINTIATTANNGTVTATVALDSSFCPHQFQTSTPAIAATCTKTGSSASAKCSFCGFYFTKPTVTPKKSHKYNSTIIKPTYFVDGYTLHTCSVCKKSYKDKTTKKLVLKVPVISSLKAGSKSFTAQLKTKVAGATGYQLQYSTSSKFTNAKTVKMTTTKTTVKKLLAKKKYYVRIRAYRTENGKTVYSTWTNAKTITTKK